LQEFLDPLDPGDYFDCGRARLHGLDDALLDEARSRGREVGDDDFLLVASDAGLFFCRPSISFAISARWDEITLIRPRGDDPVLLPVTWPRHGELKFTVSKRLAANIFRRWLQLRMHADRKKRQTGQHPVVLRTEARSGRGVGRRLDQDRDDGLDLGRAPGAGESDTEVENGGPTNGELNDPEPELEGVELQDLELEDPDLEDLEVRGAANKGGGFEDIEHLLSDEVDTDPPFPLESADGDAADPASAAVGSTPTPAETSDGLPFLEPVGEQPAAGTLADEQLERVAVPRTTMAPSSWVGSAVSLAASLVVISTVVLIATVSASIWRGTSGTPSIVLAAGEGEAATAAPPATIDHERYRSPSDAAAGSDVAAGIDGPAGDDQADQANELAPSSAGGASQSIPSSSQQLLAVPTDGPVGSSGSEPKPESESAGDPDVALRCSSNYSGCIPDVDDTAGADVDCIGQGDGPFFAETEVMVLGDDIYGLDSDGDRLACEADQLDRGPLSTGAPVGAAGG